MPQKIKDRGNGSYQLNVAVGYDNKGKQIIRSKTVHASSYREAEKTYNLFVADVHKGDVVATGKYKLADFSADWIKKHCRKNLAPKTLITYENHINRRILPALGHIDIAKIRPQHIMDFIEELESGERYDGRAGTISGESARYCFRVLSSMLQDAVQWQIIPSNPCARVKPPTVESKQVYKFNEAEVSRMIELLFNEPLKYRVVTMLALDSGLRLGELMGLKWSDVDIENRLLNVSRSNQALHGKGIITKKPKTVSSVRQISLSDSVTDLLKIYRNEQKKQKDALEHMWKGGNWLFTQWDGSPMYPTTPSAWFRKFLRRNGLPHIPFHGLRHLSATLLIALGVPLKNVSSRLGHADIRTTANIYSSALQSVDRQAADKMDNFLKNTSKKKKSIKDSNPGKNQQ